jgi:hypothetical protein
MLLKQKFQEMLGKRLLKLVEENDKDRFLTQALFVSETETNQLNISVTLQNNGEGSYSILLKDDDDFIDITSGGQLSLNIDSSETLSRIAVSLLSNWQGENVDDVDVDFDTSMEQVFERLK